VNRCDVGQSLAVALSIENSSISKNYYKELGNRKGQLQGIAPTVDNI
jgi:hypothetical protein